MKDTAEIPYPEVENYIYSKEFDLDRLRALRTNLVKLDNVRKIEYKNYLPNFRGDIPMLVVGNKNYGLASSIANVFIPNAEFYSRTSGYNLGKREIREKQLQNIHCYMKLQLLVSALGDFSSKLAETIIKNG